MRAIITVFKTELTSPAIVKELELLSAEITEVGPAYAISPKPGKLIELLNLLRQNKVNYGTHFDVVDELR